MLRLVLLLILPKALCDSVLMCTILVRQLNKSFSLIIQNIKILHWLWCILFKNMYFWCDTKSKLVTSLHGDSNKSSYLYDLLTGWFNFPKAWEGTIKMMEKFCMCSAYLFDIFICVIAFTTTFQQNKNPMYYIIRFSHETPNTYTTELTQ